MRLQQLWQCDSLQAWNDKHGFSPGAPLDRLAASCNVPFSSSVERRRRTYIMHTSLGIHRYDHTYIYVCMAIHTYTHYTTSTGTPLCCWIYAARGSGDLLLSLSLSLTLLVAIAVGDTDTDRQLSVCLSVCWRECPCVSA